MKLSSHNKRQQLYSGRKDLSAHRVRDHPVLTPQVLSNVYLADFLTAKNQKLLYICRQLKNQGKLWAAYSASGRVKVKTTENQPAKVISDVADVVELLGQDDPALKALIESSHSNASNRGDETAAAVPRGGVPPRPATSQVAGHPGSGPAGNKSRRASPRIGGQPN